MHPEHPAPAIFQEPRSYHICRNRSEKQIQKYMCHVSENTQLAHNGYIPGGPLEYLMLHRSTIIRRLQMCSNIWH